jgi:hypothetical protein
MKPQLVVIDGGRGPESDPQRRPPAWNRDWTPGQHDGGGFTTDRAHVDVVNPRPRPGLRVFVGGSRTITDRAAIASKISQLPRNAVVLTSRTHGAAAAVRDAVLEHRLHMQVWTARMERFPTREAAYFARAEEMIRWADRVIAFWDGESTGTSHELEYARRLGKRVELVVLRPDRRLLRLGPPPPDRFPGGDAA